MAPTLPAYQVRYSKKAKYLQLRVSPKKGLEVIVPYRQRSTPVSVIESFVQQKKSWIEQKIASVVPFVANEQVLPLAFDLLAINEKWEIRYVPTKEGPLKLLSNLSQQITIIGSGQNKSVYFRLLQSWLKKIAYPHFLKQLNLLSVETTLSFNSLTIRNNTSRWGSCSSDKKISLCCKLLFLPPHLVRHILLHELCHTKYLSHGPRFWNLLTRFDPETEKHVRLIRAQREFIPSWLWCQV